MTRRLTHAAALAAAPASVRARNGQPFGSAETLPPRPAAPPWLAPSTSSQSTVTRSLRLPTVAESAELLGGGWTPLLGRLGVWADEGGDSSARWCTGALERVRRDRSRAGADERGGRRVWWSRVAAGGASE